MSQSIVCDGLFGDSKYLINIKEEPLDASSVTDIDSIKQDSPYATIEDEIDIKEESLESIDDSDLK